MDRPRLTLAHLELLEQGEFGGLGDAAQVSNEALDLVDWGLLTWDGGARKNSEGEWRTAYPGRVRVTPAGLATLAAYELGRTCACDPKL